ncbi:TetR/AcrR family transcriptional regulator [Nocardia sp. NPDC005825]|uniref:TetR/AcrR family transcriptional regulator n=1 Tax=unclassified Nocardia TaxID=2637762 RepID=UPI0033CE0893
MSQPQGDLPKARRRRGTREETERELFGAVLRLLARDGVLAGITLREVAKEAGVNHGQIYQYFGSRQALVRAAISFLVEQQRPDPDTHWEMPFRERRRAMWQLAMRSSDVIKLEALLALDGDEELHPLPELERTRKSLERDSASGALPASADGEVLHVLSTATLLGYGIFRESFARDLGIPVAELDARAAAAYDRVLAALEDAPKL